jgi:N-acetylmuramoyl-L-alanine amidase
MPGDSGAEVENLQSMLSLYGYDLQVTGIFDARTMSVVRAFQLHFRPRRVDGLADCSTIETLRLLLQSLPRAG